MSRHDLPASLPASTGAAYWPNATPFRVSAPSLKETLEAEFNIAQMRALAKVWDVNLKGASRNGFVEQVASALLGRVACMRDDPQALLEGLTAEQARFARCLFTARDHELPIPRSLAAGLWAAQQAAGLPGAVTGSLAEMFDSLRRRALVFPTHRYVGYRDVYYQWLPLSASGGNVPVLHWEGVKREVSGEEREVSGEEREVSGESSRLSPQPPLPSLLSTHSSFLDAFDLFIDAVMSGGAETRPSPPRHPQADTTSWLKGWEHDAERAGMLLNSRPGWAPDPRSGIGVPIQPLLSGESGSRLESQTGLPAAHCELMFAIATALQLVEAPDTLAARPGNAAPRHPAAGIDLGAGWQLHLRLSAVEEWLSLTSEERLLQAWVAWQEQAISPLEFGRAAGDAFALTRAIGARDLGPLDLAAEWCALRRYVVRAVRGLPPGEWISWPLFRRALFEFHPECAWTVFSPDAWWFADARHGVRLNITQYDDWSRSIGAVIEHILRESLAWFGVLDADCAGGALRAIRVTPLGDWLLRAQVARSVSAGAPFSPLPESALPRARQITPVAWLDDQRWQLPPAPDRAEFIALARKIGRPEEPAADAPGGMPFVYTLTPASVERALAEGITLPEVAAQFERFGAPMPEPAQAMFRSVADRYGRVRVYESLAVLRVSDEYALAELMAGTSLGRCIIRQISPRAVVVRADVIDDLLREFVERGYTPALA